MARKNWQVSKAIRAQLDRRIGEAIALRLERIARSLDGPNPPRGVVTPGVRALMAINLAAGAPISKFSNVIAQAAEHDDFGFVKQLVRAKEKGNRLAKRSPQGSIDVVAVGLFSKIDWTITTNWEGIIIRSPALTLWTDEDGARLGVSSHVPGLKLWTDKAAAAFIAMKIRHPSFSFEAYKKHRLRLDFRPERRAVIKHASYDPGEGILDIETENGAYRLVSKSTAGTNLNI